MPSNDKPALREQSGQERDAAHGSAFVHTHSSTQPREGQVVYSTHGKPVGVIRDGWLCKTGLDPARHMLRNPRGWCTDAAHLELPGLLGVQLVTTSGETWEAPVELWQRFGVRISRGYGDQILLPLRFWSVIQPGRARQLPLLEVPA